jgi:hypothetical protein
VLADSLVVADEGFASDVTVFPDRVEIPTVGHESFIARLHEGTIVASAFSAVHPDRNPDGFLRHVVHVTGGATTVITTTPAALEEAVVEGDLSVDQRISATEFTDPAAASTQSIHPLGLPPPGGLTISPPNVSIGVSGGLGKGPLGGSGGGSVGLEDMSLRLSPDVDADLHVSWRQLKVTDFRTSFTLGYEAQAKMKAAFNGAVTLEKKGPIFEKATRHYLTFVGELPVVYQYVFSVEYRCNLFAEGAGEASLAWHMFGEPTIGTQYKDGAWSQVGSPTDFTLETTPEVQRVGKIGASCALLPKFEMKFYGTGGVYVAAGPEGKIYFKTGKCPPPKDIELDASAAAIVEVGAEAEAVFKAGSNALNALGRLKPLGFLKRFVKWPPEVEGPSGDLHATFTFGETEWKLWPKGETQEEECEAEPPEPPQSDDTKKPIDASNPIFKTVDSCKGRADGVYCSQLFDFSAIVCKDESIQYGLQCANASKCLGPNGPGTLQCEGQSSPPPPTGTDAGAPPPDSCQGRADGTYCSTASPYAAFICKNGSTAGGAQCASGKLCVGPNGPGDIVCQ